MSGEQMQLFEVDALDPFNCPHELAVVDIGGGKTECAKLKCWTNCREVRHCTAVKL